MQWMDDALCREIGPEPFFPDYDSSAANHAAYKRAVKICQQCPVRSECYEFALNDPNIKYGIWGGHYAQQIRKRSRKEIA